MAKITFWEMFKRIVGQIGLTNVFNDWKIETWLIKRDINQYLKEALSLSKSYQKKINQNIIWWSVASQNNYSIPDNIDKISYLRIKVWDVYYYPSEISIWDFNNVSNNIQTSDYIQYFCINNNEILFYPTFVSNSNEITINWTEKMVDMETDSSSSDNEDTELDIKEWYENVIFYRALEYAYLRINELSLADRFWLKADRLFERFKNEVSAWTNSILIKNWSSKPLNPNDFTEFTR